MPNQHVEFDKPAELFLSRDGAEIVVGAFGRPFYLRPANDSDFIEGYSRGIAGSSESYEATFEVHLDGVNPETIELKREASLIQIEGGALFVKEGVVEGLDYVPLPAIRKVDYFFAAPGGEVIYVSSNLYNDMYDTWRVFRGKPGDMREIPLGKPEGADTDDLGLGDIVRYRDGGTTFVSTVEGVLYSPSPFNNPSRNGTWTPAGGETGQTLTPLNVADFEISESEAGVSIVAKTVERPGPDGQVIAIA